MRNEKSNPAVPPRQQGGALPKEQESFIASIEGQSDTGSSIRLNNQPTRNITLRNQGEGPAQDKGVLPFAVRSLYRVVVRFAEVDAMIVAISMDLLLGVHSDEESLRYFPDLTDAETSELIIKKQGLTIFLASTSSAEQLLERFARFRYVSGVEITPINQLGSRDFIELPDCEEAN